MKYPIFLLIVFISSYSFGQNKFPFPKSGAKWEYLQIEMHGQPYGHTRTFVQGKDTSIYHWGDTLLLQEIVELGWVNDVVAYFKYDSLDNVIIYDKMLDFPSLWYSPFLKIGQKVGFKEDDIYRIDSVKVNGEYRKKFIIYRGALLEGVGFISHLPLIEPVVGAESFYLLCMHVDDSLIYKNEEYNTCDTSFILDLKEPKKTDGLVNYILPNPNKGNFQLIIPDYEPNHNYSLSLYSINGSKVYGSLILNQKTAHSLHFIPGIYFYSLTIINGIIYRGKLVID